MKLYAKIISSRAAVAIVTIGAVAYASGAGHKWH
jgi:hypothetical protein